ncbi:hypothetical protein ABK040_009802 [Willaertia magna]
MPTRNQQNHYNHTTKRQNTPKKLPKPNKIKEKNPVKWFLYNITSFSQKAKYHEVLIKEKLIKRIESKSYILWLHYNSEISTSTNDYYTLSKPTYKPEGNEKIEVAACLLTFTHSCSFILKNSLDSTYFKRYQRNIHVGSLNPFHFDLYFSLQKNPLFIHKGQKLVFENERKDISYIGYEFKSLDDLPLLGCKKEYASRLFFVDQAYNLNINNKTQAKRKKINYRIYYDRILFICNIKSWLITVDFDFKYEYYDVDKADWFDV